MKKLLYLFTLSIILYSCNNPEESKEASTNNDSIQQIKDTTNIPKKITYKKKKDAINNTDSNFFYEPSISIISGTLKEEEFLGAPGYGATPDKDEKEKQYILYLDNPINVKPGKGSDEALETKTKVDRITLIIEKKTGKFKHDIGKTIKVKGKLFPSETGHHHTPVLLGEAELIK